MASVPTSMDIKPTNNPKNLPYQMYAVPVQDGTGQKHPVYQICKKLIFTKNGKSVSSYMAATPDEMKKSAGTQGTLNVINVSNSKKMVIGLPAFAHAPVTNVQTTPNLETIKIQPTTKIQINPDRQIVQSTEKTVKLSNNPQVVIGSQVISKTPVTTVQTQTTNVLSGNQVQATKLVSATTGDPKVVVCTTTPVQSATGTRPVQFVLSPQVASQTKLANGNLQMLKVGGKPIKSETATMPVKPSSSTAGKPILLSITQSSICGTQTITTVPTTPISSVTSEPYTKSVAIPGSITATAGTQPMFMTISPLSVTSANTSYVQPRIITATSTQPVRVLLSQPNKGRNITMLTVPASQIKTSQTKIAKSTNPPVSPITVYSSGASSPKVSAVTPIIRATHDLSKLLTPPPTPDICDSEKSNACTTMPANSSARFITIANASVPLVNTVPMATILTKQTLSNVAKVQPIVPVAIRAAANAPSCEAHLNDNDPSDSKCDSKLQKTAECDTNEKHISDTAATKCDEKPMFTIDSVFSLSESSANDLFPEAARNTDEQPTSEESKPSQSLEGAGILSSSCVGMKIKTEPPDTGYEKALQIKKEPPDTGYEKALLSSNAEWRATSSNQSEKTDESATGTPEVVDYQYPMVVTPSVMSNTPGEPMRWTVQTSPPASSSKPLASSTLLASSTQSSSIQLPTSSTQLLVSAAQPPTSSTHLIVSSTQSLTSSTQSLTAPTIIKTSAPILKSLPLQTSATILVKTLANLKAASAPGSSISAYYVKGADGKTGLLQIHSASAKLSEIANTAMLDSQKSKNQPMASLTTTVPANKNPMPAKTKPTSENTELIGQIKSIIPENQFLNEVIIKQEKTDDENIIFPLSTTKKRETTKPPAPTRVLRKRKQNLPALSETRTTDAAYLDPSSSCTDEHKETIQEERIRKLKELLKTKTAALEEVRKKGVAKRQKMSNDDEDTESAEET
ncbi:uncharacterized protein LOC100375667 [Saccoglossus kowalevskii]|uniref:Mucin-17-like n=1 Tax=Saccoglossus kowalevskii TaxID=10224 RepID=A0ABM0M558_SACKO|nr:PREDICTED: mucin-17-like [Saccoglossus kowalevskii]